VRDDRDRQRSEWHRMTAAEADWVPSRQVAIGMSDGVPWCGVDAVDDFEGQHGWCVVEVPNDLAAAFESAQAKVRAALTAIIDASGFDPDTGRMKEACADYRGETMLGPGSEPRWHRCRRCGWGREDHRSLAARGTRRGDDSGGGGPWFQRYELLPEGEL
jgi:hypothetical protein